MGKFRHGDIHRETMARKESERTTTSEGERSRLDPSFIAFRKEPILLTLIWGF
jgi:hypothetical protein